MRGFRLAALAVLVAVASAPRPHAQGLPFSLFERYLESLREQTGIPGISAVIVQGGRPVWSAGLGRQDVERSIGARDDTVYPIGDLTQTFAAVLVGQCVDTERAQHQPAHPPVDRHDSRRARPRCATCCRTPPAACPAKSSATTPAGMPP